MAEHNLSKFRRTHRFVRERRIIKGTLVLETPACFCSGAEDSFTDMPLLRDESDGSPLLPGTSVAGALRNYLREYACGYGIPFPRRTKKDSTEPDDEFRLQQEAERNRASTILFGGYKGDDEGMQSPLIVYDAVGKTGTVELRDGVTIDGYTGTAAEDKKFDIELLCAGTTFDLQFELIVTDIPGNNFPGHRQTLLNALATALDGFSRGAIALGTRKTRGYGQCSVSEWEVRCYDMTSPGGLLAWLASERKDQDSWGYSVARVYDTDIAKALGNTADPLPDARRHATLKAEFALEGPVMIRSGFGESDSGPDMVHLHSLRLQNRDKKNVPVIPGTSWAGVLRHRAIRIARTIAGGTETKSLNEFIEGIFGPADAEKNNQDSKASRLWVSESEIRSGCSLVQSRIRIDRFTGGTIPGALFDEQPVFGNQDTRVTLSLSLRSGPPEKPGYTQEIEPAEVGLVLLVLKDLWTGDLPVGGESGIGRGRLRGKEAELKTGGKEWKIKQKGDKLSISGDQEELENFVDQFVKRTENYG